MSAEKQDYIGRVYESLNYGKFKVVQELIPVGYGKYNRLFEIEFLDTGYRSTATQSSLYFPKPDIKDRFLSSIYNIGTIGQEDIFSYERNRIIYKVWECMISRCYNKKDKVYKHYGALGVKVSDSWLTYANFENDVKQKPFYIRKMQEPHMFHLDKDYLQQGIPTNQKIYSNETCLWVSMYENALLKGFDNSFIKYYGVVYDSGYYYTIVFTKYYGRFSSPEDAALFFNYIYPVLANPKYITLGLHNNVPIVSFNELMSRNLLINKTNLNPVLETIKSNNLYQ